ncbi:MAG: hypothetical protein JSS72_06025 [Armatimonadetes bacterium]|nr:hypothetical protein [Armatimonadota bacterium]
MSSMDLRRLWELHEIDSAILDIRHKAAALDGGKAAMEKLKKLEAEQEAANSEAKRINGEMLDLELQQKTHAEKIKKIDKELYSGQVVNAKEVMNLEKEIEILKRKISELEDQQLALMDQIGPAEAKGKKFEPEIQQTKAEAAAKRKIAMEQKGVLEAEFARLNKLRPEAAKKVNPPLLTRYEAIRQNQHGIGMTKVTKNSRCGVCGTLLPERLIEAARKDQAVTCEECKRILYYSEGLL